MRMAVRAFAGLAGSRGNFTEGRRLGIRMALFRRVEERNYKLEPDCFRQGRTAVLHRPLSARGGGDSWRRHCREFTDSSAVRKSKFSIARK